MNDKMKPRWLKADLPNAEKYAKIKRLLSKGKLHTVCEEAKCPNLGECWDRGTATFLILGDNCTRNCLYCNVKHDKPVVLNPDEPKDIAETVKKLKLKYVVITSVTRDDLEDYGALNFMCLVNEIKKTTPNCKIELLIPDFKADMFCIDKVVHSKPDVIGHNIEVVKRLFKKIRPQADYDRSLTVLKMIKELDKDMITKSGFMVGFGESEKDIEDTLKDLRGVGVDIVTIGQYLQPSKENIEVKKYYPPDEFRKYKSMALKLGFLSAECGPLVRSSYHAEDVLNAR